jgi:hypothetical protein
MTSSSITQFAPAYRLQQEEVTGVSTWVGVSYHHNCVVSVVCDVDQYVLVGLSLDKRGDSAEIASMLHTHFETLRSQPQFRASNVHMYFQSNTSLNLVQNSKDFLKTAFPSMRVDWLCHVPGMPKQRGVHTSKQMKEDAAFFMLTDVMHNKRFHVAERCMAQPAVVELLLQLRANTYDGDSAVVDLSLLLLMLHQRVGVKN